MGDESILFKVLCIKPLRNKYDSFLTFCEWYDCIGIDDEGNDEYGKYDVNEDIYYRIDGDDEGDLNWYESTYFKTHAEIRSERLGELLG